MGESLEKFYTKLDGPHVTMGFDRTGEILLIRIEEIHYKGFY